MVIEPEPGQNGPGAGLCKRVAFLEADTCAFYMTIDLTDKFVPGGDPRLVVGRAPANPDTA